MAATPQNFYNGYTNGAQASITVSVTVGAGTSLGLLVHVASYSGVTIRSVMYGDVALQQVGTGNAGDHRITTYELPNPTVGTANLVVTPSSNAWMSVGACVLTEYGGVRTFQTVVNGNSTAPTITVTSATGDLVLDICASWASNQQFTVGAGQTSGYEQDSQVNTDVKSAGSSEPGAATVTMSWTLGTSAVWTMGGVSIYDDSTANDLRIAAHRVQVLQNAVPTDLRIAAHRVQVLQRAVPTALHIAAHRVQVLVQKSSLLDPGDGGGEGPVGTNPAAGIVPSDVPEVFAVFTLDGVDYAFGVGQYNDAPTYFGGRKDSKIKDISTIKYQLTKEGGPQAVTFTVTVLDGDRVFADRAGTTDQIKGGFCAVYVIDHDDRIAELRPKRIGAGYITKCESDDNFQFKLTVKDALSVRLAKIDKEPALPPGKYNLTEFPEIDPSMDGKSIQLVLGKLSDEFRVIPQGDVPPQWVGDINLSVFGGEDDEFDAYIWSQGTFVNNGIFALYYNDESTPEFRVLAPLTAAPSVYVTPFHPGWAATVGVATNYLDWYGRRYMPLFIRKSHPIAPLVKSGNVLVGANIAGTEDAGDTTGLMIDSPARLVPFVLTNYVFNRYMTGAYETIPEYAPATDTDYSWIDTDSFEEVHDYFLTRFPVGGYTVGTILGFDGSPQTCFQFLQEACEGSWFDIYINLDGQLAASVYDPDSVAVATFDAISDIEKGSYKVTQNDQRLINRVEHEYARYYVAPYAPAPTPAEGDPAPSKPIPDYHPYRSGIKITEGAAALTSQVNTGEIATKTLQNQFVREDDVAQDVSDRIIEEGLGPTGYGPHEWTMRGGWQLIQDGIKLGKNIYVKHPAKWNTGERDFCRITTMEISPIQHRVVLGGDVIEHE